jgi:ATP-dependent RNA helicase DDX52/ROK1
MSRSANRIFHFKWDRRWKFLPFEMGDAFALLRAGTSFDRKGYQDSQIGLKPGDKKTLSSEIPFDLDFFGDTPKNEPQIVPDVNPKKRKRTDASIEDVDPQQLRRRCRINVTGTNPPAPISSFESLSQFDPPEYLTDNIDQLQFSTPTPIQMQAIPIILEKRDLLACAPTGSGKTLAYIIPLLMQLKSHESKGFRAVIISPTRELAQQVLSPSCKAYLD